MLGLTSFCVQMHPGAAAFWRVYFWVYSVFEVGVLFLRGGEGMAGLTDTEIRKSKAAEKAYSMGDGGGLYLWVKPTGGKLWRWSYRFDGNEKLMSLGKYPDVSLAQARERHSEARKLFATGVDPMAQRSEEHTSELQSLRHLVC